MTESQDADPIANPDDIDLKSAIRAYQGTSFHPEDRGERDRLDYAADVNGLHADLLNLASTDHQKEVLRQQIAEYRNGYRLRLSAYHAASSRLVSTMIAGPSNFPVRQMEKRGEIVHKRLSELVEWKKKAREAIRKKLLDARPADVKALMAWKAVERDILRSLATVAGIDDGTERGYSRELFVSSVVGKVERLAKNGEASMVDSAVALVKSLNEKRKKPLISPRSKFWTLPEVARRSIARDAEAATGEPATVCEGEGFQVVSNPALDRVQILFEAVPDAETRARLKGEGWNWSRREGAWQRKLTPNAVTSARRIVAQGAAVEG